MQKGLDKFYKWWYENYHDAELGFRAWFGFIYAKLPPKRSFFITPPKQTIGEPPTPCRWFFMANVRTYRPALS